jgi:hypothetical protein
MKAKLILIDTCIWKQLIDKLDPTRQLPQLQSWIAERRLQLLVPEQLAQEWNKKHRKEELDDIDKAIKSHVKELKRTHLFGMLPSEDPHLSIAEQKLRTQVEVVDKLLDQGVQLSESAEIAKLIRELQKKRLPPFHNKEDSLKDAFILLPALEYAATEDPPELIFISNNYKEFESEDTPGMIHPKLQQLFRDVKIQYYRSWTAAADALIQNGLHRIEKTTATFKTRIVLKSTLPVDQLAEYLQKQFGEFTYLPKRYFNYHPPLIIEGPTPLSIDQPFELATNNHPLYEALDDLRVPEAKDANIHIIKRILGRNNILRITEDIWTGITVFHDDPAAPCDCIACRYSQFLFPSCYDSLVANDHPDAAGLLQKAFYYYRFREYDKALEICNTALKSAEANQKRATAFIAAYNTNMLLRLNDHALMIGELTIDITKAYPAFDLHESLEHYKDAVIQDILEDMMDEKYFQQAENKVQRLVGEIREGWFSRSGGFNNHFSELLSEMLDVRNFLALNYIILDQMAPFSRLVAIFMEGTLASYGSDESLGGRLTQFSDWVIETFFLYGKDKNLAEYCDWYKVDNLQIMRGQGMIFSHIADWLKSHSSKDLQPFYGARNREFQRYCHTLANNALGIFSFFDVPAEQLEHFHSPAGEVFRD